MAKKNILKIPKNILDRIKDFDQDDVVVACAKLIKHDEISNYASLGLKIINEKLVIPEPKIPNPEAGRFSKANIEGLEKTKKDLPKILKDIYCGDRPIYGDWSKGSFPLWQTREVYRRDFIPPKEVELEISLVEKKEDSYILKFAINQVINRRTPNFEQELFYNLNLLQESIGSIDVFESTATLEEYSAQIKVDWVILPPGTVDEVVKKIIESKIGSITPEQESTIKERVTQISKFKPTAYISGGDNFLRYFGAKFGDDFVVFENVRYGNAIYVMYENWEELSKKSRTDLLTGFEESFERIVHKEGWKEKLEALIRTYKTKNE